MSTARTFFGDTFGEGMQWTFKSLFVALIIGIGWKTGYLQETCIGVIAAFVFLQGFLPYCRLAIRLNKDRHKCREEKIALQDFPVENAHRFAEIDARDAGSIFKLVAAIEANRDRMGKSEAANLFLGVAEQEWKSELRPVVTSAELSPFLGLGGSLIGMIAGIASLAAAMGGNSADEMLTSLSPLFNSMSVMMTTTLTGCFGAFLLTGLAAIATNSIERHLADLRMIAGLMANDEEHDDSDDKNDGDDYFLSGVAA